MCPGSCCGVHQIWFPGAASTWKLRLLYRTDGFASILITLINSGNFNVLAFSGLCDLLLSYCTRISAPLAFVHPYHLHCMLGKLPTYGDPEMSVRCYFILILLRRCLGCTLGWPPTWACCGLATPLSGVWQRALTTSPSLLRSATDLNTSYIMSRGYQSWLSKCLQCNTVSAKICEILYLQLGATGHQKGVRELHAPFPGRMQMMSALAFFICQQGYACCLHAKSVLLAIFQELHRPLKSCLLLSFWDWCDC